MPLPVAGKRRPQNHLANEKSPYLRQHADNPVDWYPWGEEAFRRAAEENKPVFLSIGYSTCHWCHVMGRESFSDTDIAGLLNTGFISVKVDREERPDIDSMYMSASLQMTGQGGWPLTIIMTPDKKPFFAATYLPKKSRNGITGLTDILQNVVQLWHGQRDTLVEAAEQLSALLAETISVPEKAPADHGLLRQGYEELAASFDPEAGGFGRAPKFPAPVTLLFLLRYWKRTGSDLALRMVIETLEALRCGGIHDHLGGGFHRYSTDNRWFVPHFEKMLYDQALLLAAFTEAWLATGEPVFRETAEEIITYVTRDLVSPENAFISAEDADSPGGEGAYYLWTRKELDDVLGPEDGNYAAGIFGVLEKGNFPLAEGGSGKNILFLKTGREQISQDRDRIRTGTIRAALFAARKKRPRPQRDTKVLADWNGLMIAALALAFRSFDNPKYSSGAETAMHFILDRMRMPDGGLYHRYCDGEAAVAGFADDYAYIIRALIELYETRFDPFWLKEALRLDRYLMRHFFDRSGCGFFSTSDTGEALLIRKKEIFDGALPSGNSVILQNLVLLGHLTGDPQYDIEASFLADFLAGSVTRSPASSCAYLCALGHLLGPSPDIVIAAEEPDGVAQAMIRTIYDTYNPSVTVHFRRSSQKDSPLDTLAPFTRAMTAKDGKATAYACSGRSCSDPLYTPESLREFLNRN